MKSDFDKLRNLSIINEDTFSFKCPECKTGSKDLFPKPLDICVRPYVVVNGSLFPQSNKDLNGIICDGQDMGDYFDSLPTIRNALLNLDKEKIIMECFNCDHSFSLPSETSNDELNRFIRKRYPEDMVLDGRKK